MFPFLWPCQPAEIYVTPDVDPHVIESVEQWRRSFRPDWTFTSDFDGAELRIVIDPEVLGSVSATIVDGHVDTYTVRLAPLTGVYAGDVVEHELMHVAGFGHHPEAPPAAAMAGQADGRRGFTVGQMALLRWAGLRGCRR